MNSISVSFRAVLLKTRSHPVSIGTAMYDEFKANAESYEKDATVVPGQSSAYLAVLENFWKSFRKRFRSFSKLFQNFSGHFFFGAFAAPPRTFPEHAGTFFGTYPGTFPAPPRTFRELFQNFFSRIPHRPLQTQIVCWCISMNAMRSTYSVTLY